MQQRDLNRELEQIISKHGLERSGKPYNEYIYEKIEHIIFRQCTGRRIAIKGAGRHTCELLARFQLPGEVVGIFDARVAVEGSMVVGGKEYPLYPDIELEGCSADTIIISSYTHKEEMKNELREIGISCNVVDIYEEILRDGLYLHEPFYYNTAHAYESVLFDLNIYKKSDENTKGKCLCNLILSYIGIRDFLNAFFYMDVLIEGGYEDTQRFSDLKAELSCFLDGVRKALKKRWQNDLLIVWNDQLGYEDLNRCAFLKSESEKGLTLEQAFTVAPFTFPSFMAMFNKKYSLDDKIYFARHDKLGAKNLVIGMLQGKGYAFRYIGENITASYYEQEYKRDYGVYDSSCVRCFDTLEEVLNSDEPICIILHALVETHNPYLSGELEQADWFDWPYIGKDVVNVNKQMDASSKYWDKQLAYYIGFFKDGCTKVYMSDHGKRYAAEPVYNDNANHVICIIRNRWIAPAKESRLFSLVNFYELLDYLTDVSLSEVKYNKLFSEMISMQEVGIFNATAIKYYMEQNTRESAMPYRAARGPSDKYILLNTGKEYYFRLPDEETNYIDDSVYAERVEILKKAAGDYFLDFNDYYKELHEFRKLYEA